MSLPLGNPAAVAMTTVAAPGLPGAASCLAEGPVTGRGTGTLAATPCLVELGAQFAERRLGERCFRCFPLETQGK